jgi:hypothetical protein
VESTLYITSLTLLVQVDTNVLIKIRSDLCSLPSTAIAVRFVVETPFFP